MTSSWFFLSTLNYDARSTTHQIRNQVEKATIKGLSPTFTHTSLGECMQYDTNNRERNNQNLPLSFDRAASRVVLFQITTGTGRNLRQMATTAKALLLMKDRITLCILFQISCYASARNPHGAINSC